MDKPRKSHMKLVPLLPQETSEDNEPNKDELNKRPKKFHRRVRRNANGGHIVRKRNPYFRHLPKISPDVPTQVQYVYVKHSVPGKKHNGLDLPVPPPTVKPTTEGNVPISFDNRVAADENDRVIFPSVRRTTARPTSRPTESIFRDPRPENFDFSFMNQGQQLSTQQVNVARGPTSPPAPPTTQAGISQCVWAIVNCCTGRSNEIRYSCFEQNGCYGAFWGLNPCADNVRDSFVNYVAEYYN
ncbi:hypothetical protein DOY81_011857 [Sarcophaga bullata]|nr:hypothetical protein DOY81_011857 [Sarcophaga bullata]